MRICNFAKKRNFVLAFLCVVIGAESMMLSGCYFFRKRHPGEKDDEQDGYLLGKSLGPKASGPIYARLEEIYAINTDKAPAAIRPDPDTYVRNLLLQYRSEGSTVARQIGRVEAYRPLMGGASEDFVKDPQDRYDATSLLANLKVAHEICRGLVAPNASEHPGWSTILPANPSDKNTNIRFLAQRFTGILSSDIETGAVDRLREILDQSAGGGAVGNDNYVHVCTALAMDAASLLL